MLERDKWGRHDMVTKILEFRIIEMDRAFIAGLLPLNFLGFTLTLAPSRG